MASGRASSAPRRGAPWRRRSAACRKDVIAMNMITRIENGLRAAVEGPTAALVLAEIAVLLAGVVSRFVFHHPFVWSDELASILFLWLAMLGAVVALQRMQRSEEHTSNSSH